MRGKRRERERVERRENERERGRMAGGGRERESERRAGTERERERKKEMARGYACALFSSDSIFKDFSSRSSLQI